MRLIIDCSYLHTTQNCWSAEHIGIIAYACLVWPSIDLSPKFINTRVSYHVTKWSIHKTILYIVYSKISSHVSLWTIQARFLWVAQWTRRVCFGKWSSSTARVSTSIPSRCTSFTATRHAWPVSICPTSSTLSSRQLSMAQWTCTQYEWDRSCDHCRLWMKK